MAPRWTVLLFSSVILVTCALGCDRPRAGEPVDTAVVSSPAPPSASPSAPTPIASTIASTQAAAPQTAAPEEEPTEDSDDDDSPVVFPRDSVLLRRAVDAFAARSIYVRWKPDSADDGNDPVCRDPGDEGYYLNAAWGLGRAHVIGLAFEDSTGARASAQLEVVRVLSIEGDPETSDGRYASADMLVVAPVVDTIELGFRRRRDGRWVQCYVFDHVNGIPSPISLTGSPADTLTPRGQRLTRSLPPGASWKRVRALADSVAQ